MELPAEERSWLRSTQAEPDVATEHREPFTTIAALPECLHESLVAVDLVES